MMRFDISIQYLDLIQYFHAEYIHQVIFLKCASANSHENDEKISNRLTRIDKTIRFSNTNL